MPLKWYVFNEVFMGIIDSFSSIFISLIFILFYFILNLKLNGHTQIH